MFFGSLRLRLIRANRSKSLLFLTLPIFLLCVLLLFEFVNTYPPTTTTPLQMKRILIVSIDSPSVSLHVNKTKKLLQSLNYSYDIINVDKHVITLDSLVDLRTGSPKYTSIIVVAQLLQWYLSNNEISAINRATQIYGIGQLWIFTWHNVILENFGLECTSDKTVNSTEIYINGTDSEIDGIWNESIPVLDIVFKDDFTFVRKTFSTTRINENRIIPIVCFRRLGNGNAVLVNFDTSKIKESGPLWKLFEFSFKLSLRGIII